MAVRTRCGELLLLLFGRKEDRSGRPNARVVVLGPLVGSRGRRRLGRWVVFIVLVLVLSWWETGHTFWRWEGRVVRLGSRKVRKGRIEEGYIKEVKDIHRLVLGVVWFLTRKGSGSAERDPVSYTHLRAHETDS